MFLVRQVAQFYKCDKNKVNWRVHNKTALKFSKNYAN